jgi:hypothetical protein
MNEFKFVDFIKVYFQKPIETFAILFNQPKFKYVYLLPIIFGFILGINDIINKSYLPVFDFNLGLVCISITKEILITILACYIYSWIMLFLNSLFQGYSNQSMAFAVISYSLVPLIVGYILITIIKLIAFSVLGLTEYAQIITRLLYIMYLAFYIVTIIFLIIGNSISNRFSILKSIIPSSILPIILTIYEITKLF